MTTSIPATAIRIRWTGWKFTRQVLDLCFSIFALKFIDEERIWQGEWCKQYFITKADWQTLVKGNVVHGW